MSPTFDAKDQEILDERIAKYNERKGPRVGDFVYLQGEDKPRRFTYDWGKDIQATSGFGESFYLGPGYIEFSGGLSSPIVKNDLHDTGETRMGSVWFFHHHRVEAHNGVHAEMPFRVFRQD